MDRDQYFVVLHKGEWKIKHNGRYSHPYETQADAIRSAIDAAHTAPREGGLSQVLVQGQDLALAFTLGGLVFIILALGAVVVFPLALAWFGFESRSAELIAVLRWPVLFVIVTLALFVLYRYGASRTPPRWQWLSVGTLFATLAWLAVSALFSWYLAKFAHYDATYGSLGGVIDLMWLWLSVIVILIGAELNAEIEHQPAHDRYRWRKAAWHARCGHGGHAWRSVAVTWKIVSCAVHPAYHFSPQCS